MNKLNGGYVMINLDETSTLAKQLLTASESGKPVIAYIDGKGNYAVIGSDTNFYYVYLPNNVMYSYNKLSGVLASGKNIVDKYIHRIGLSFAISGTTHVVYVEIINTKEDAYTSTNKVQAIGAINTYGYASVDTPCLASDSADGFINIYVEFYQGSPRLYYKASGASAYAYVASSSINFNSDNVIKL